MRGVHSSSMGRFQRRPSLGTSIARAMISMSPDVFTEKSPSSLSIKLSTSAQSSILSPSTAMSQISETSSTTLQSFSTKSTSSYSPDYQTTEFNSLELPNELNIVFNRLDTWQEPHSERDIIEISRSSNVIPIEQHIPPSYPSDSSSLIKYLQEHTNIGNKWDRLLSPIKEPFTNHLSNQQHKQLALMLFKLILRFVNASERDHKRDRVLADYIVQMGLMHEMLRDEILLQIINQIWNNIDLIKLDKAWLLMANCLSCFSSSAKFYKYLFKFLSDEISSNKNEICKRKLSAAGSVDAPRTYPPTQLEWSANKRSISMALPAKFADNVELFGEVESWMTGEQYAYELVSSRGILKDSCLGWSVTLEDEENEIELMGHDYILDLIGELEIPPCTPVCKSFFLIHDGRDRSLKTSRRRNHRSAVRSKEWFLKVDQKRSSRLSKHSRRTSSSNHSSPSKYLRSDEQHNDRKDSSPVYHDVNIKKSTSSLSSFEMSDDHLSFPPPPSTVKDLLKTDRMSIYSKTDEEEHHHLLVEKINDDHQVKLVNLSADSIKTEPKGSIRKSNVFTSSSHSIVDAGCGGHILSKIPALRCLRSNKAQKTSPKPPATLATSDHNGQDNPTSFYGEYSVCSDGPTNFNQYEKIGSSIHHVAKPNDEYHLSSFYSDGGNVEDIHEDLSDYETEEIPIKKSSPLKGSLKQGNKFIKNKSSRPKSGYPQGKKVNSSIFDSESIATITDLPLPCHKSDVEAFLDDLFDRALDAKHLSKTKNKKLLLSTLDQHRLQMISNSTIDPSIRRNGLANLFPKKSSIRPSSININEKKKAKQEKKRTKSKTKRVEQMNANNNNNNNNNNLTDHSFMTMTSDSDIYLPQEKKNIKLIPINPAVCFATTTSANHSKTHVSTGTNSNGPVFVPVIDISGKKYLPVYLKQSTDGNTQNEQIDQTDNMPNRLSNSIAQFESINSLNMPRQTTSTIIEENESEHELIPSSPSILKPKLSVERLSISQIDPKHSQNESSNSIRNQVKVPSHIYIRRSPESQKNLRAKTVRIGKIRWPPPLNPEDVDNANQQRRILVQRRIQEEIHGNKLNTHLDSPSIDQPINNIQQSQFEDKDHLSPSNDQPKKSSTTHTFNDCLSPISIDDDMSTNEIIARNQPSKLEGHKTLMPMIGKENFELRKKLFEHPDSDSSSADLVPILSRKSSSRQSSTYLTYTNIPWKLKIRKEIFSPKETFDQPILIDLLYIQIAYDTFSNFSIRISEAERTNMKTFLSSHGVASSDDINLITKISSKKTIIEQARQWPTYFSRFFPVSIPKFHSGEIQMLGISHSGIRLIKRSRTKTNGDILQVLETILFDNIQQISSIRNGSTMDLRLSKKKSVIIHSHRIQKIKQLIEKFLKESRSFSLKQATSPNIISNTSDLLKSSSQASLISCSQTFSELIPSISMDNHTPMPTKNERTISALPNGYSMMEFALHNYKLPNRRRSKKSWKNSEWTWQDYSELLKWSKHPIQTPLLRQSSNDISRIARQCFLAIMRFMGDHTFARGQTDIDCLLYILKNIHKHRTLIDEVLCQLIKQLTENKSTKLDSIQRGWKLLVIILNYFIPSEHLRPFFIKYLNDNIQQNEKLVQLCLHHYEQTLKYGGRKNAPSKAEIDLLTANGRNGGKRQTFLLPGGTPLTLLTTPSMVIGDCSNLLCERFNITNHLEYDEYSIFIISTADHSSRLLKPNEYLFDILSECVRSNILDYHFILKRMLWFTIPIDKTHQSDIFIDFMYHQLLPEYLEGLLIIMKNNHLTDELMQQIAFIAALQYRASNRIGLPSMREVKHLLPVTVLKLKSVRPQVWTTTVHEQLYSSVENLTPIEAKIKFLNLIQTWPLFGTTFFVVQSVDDSSISSPCFIGINKTGLLFLDMDTRETLFAIPYNDVVSIRRHQMTIDIKYGSLNQPHVLQCQIERSQDLVALTGRYLSFIGRSLSSALERRANSEQFYRASTSAYNDPISTIL